MKLGSIVNIDYGFKWVYPELCVNSKLAQNRARIILGRKTAVRDSALAAS